MYVQFDAVDDVYSLIAARAALSPKQAAFHLRRRTGGWETVCWRDYHDTVVEVARGLMELGLKAGDRVGILAAQSYRWEVSAKAVLACGGVVAGIDHLASGSQKSGYIKKVQPAFLLVDDEERLRDIAPQALNGVSQIVSFAEEGDAHTTPWPTLLSAAKSAHALPDISSTAPATVIFTSGSSGEPKAVSFTHGQLVLAARSILDAFGPAGEDDVTLCWLPLSNLFQRVMNVCAISAGMQTYFSDDPRRIAEDIAEVQPSVFIGVPRFYEKVSERAEAAIASLPAWQRGGLRSAMRWRAAAVEKSAQGVALSLPERLRLVVADKLLLGSLRSRVFGQRIRLLITGSAATPVPVKQFFAGLGLPLMEAYAMSENIVPMTVSRSGVGGLGCVGRPLPENEIRIDESGEILVRGPGVFGGYFGEEQPELLFTEEGFFRTGDLGRFDETGCLHLTGRKSELIKTSTGRRIPPTPIEAALRAEPLVQDAVVVGNGRKCLTAVIALDHEAASHASSDDLLNQLSRHVQRTNQSRASYEHIAGCVVLKDGFSISDGHLTTNLKPRRGHIEDAVAQPLERLYRAINDNSVEEASIRRVDDIAFADAS